MRRDAAPAHGSGEAELVEPARVVVGDAGRKQRTLPLDSRSLEAFKLRESFEDALFPAELCLRREVLPAEQPAHVDGGSNRFDLLTKRAECKAMDALEDAALAPFDLMLGAFFR